MRSLEEQAIGFGILSLEPVDVLAADTCRGGEGEGERLTRVET